MQARKFYEKNGISVDPFAVTSVSTQYSTPVKLDNADKICFCISGKFLSSAAISQNFGIGVYEAESATKCNSANAAMVAGTSLLMGCTASTYIDYAKKVEITLGATTDYVGVSFTLNGIVMAFTSAAANYSTNATNAGNATLYFGSSVLSTLDTGPQLTAGCLTSVINLCFPKLAAATITTNTMEIWVKNTASTYITINTTGVGLILGATFYEEKIIELLPRHFHSTAQYCNIHLSSASTGPCAAAVMTIKDDMFIAPAPQHAYILPTTS